MSKITRQTFVQFGVNVNAAADICEFGTPATGSPVYTNTIATLQANSAWTTGWAAETISSNRPFLEDMNAVCYVFSYMLAYLMEMGIPEYDASTTYYTNSIVQYSGTLYQSIADSNTGNTPSVGAYWKYAVPAISGIIGSPVSKTAATLYQAATDGFVIGVGECGGGAGLTINIGPTSGLAFSDIAFEQTPAVGGQVDYRTLCVLVPKGWYWETGGSGGAQLNTTLYFMPIGT